MKIIVALDVYSLFHAQEIIHSIKNNENIIYKIGHPLFLREGEKSINLIYNETINKLFLDFKWHDIQNTVIESCRAIKKYKPYMITIHAACRQETLKEAKAVLGETKLIAVTKLTDQDSTELVLPLAVHAIEAGADGLVCPGHKIELLKKYFPNTELVVPGIRPSWYTKEDEQINKITPKEAYDFGADYIVMGRPIINSDNPGEVVRKIEEEIEQ